MTNPYRAMCAELVDDLEMSDWPSKLKETFRADIDRARALLADPEPEDCDELEFCWLPANALPTPEATNG